MLPLVKATQRVGGTGFGMLPDTAGQHQEFTPRLFIIVVHNCGQGSGKGLAPQMAGTVRHMAKGWGATWLNFLESREPSLGCFRQSVGWQPGVPGDKWDVHRGGLTR